MWYKQYKTKHYLDLLLSLYMNHFKSFSWLQRFLLENICNDYKQESNLPCTEVAKYQSMLRRNDTFFRNPVKDHCLTGVAHHNYREAIFVFSFKDTIFKLIFKLACRLVGLTMKSAYMYCFYYPLLKLSSPVLPLSLLLVPFFPQIIVPVSTFTSHTSPSLCTYIPWRSHPPLSCFSF